MSLSGPRPGLVRVLSVPSPDPASYARRRSWPTVSKADLARIDRILAGKPPLVSRPRLSTPRPADGSAPKGWTLIAA